MKKAVATQKPKRQPLSPERIMHTAIEMMDKEGFAALSMRKLAGKLHVEAMSLYDHFPSKEALLLAMRSHFYQQLNTAIPSKAAWHDFMAANMNALYQLGVRHPSFVAVHLHVLSVPESRQRGDIDLAVLTNAGFSERDAASAIVTLVSYVIGFLHRMVLTSQPSGSRIGEIVRKDQEATFQFGLNAILVGLKSDLRGKS